MPKPLPKILFPLLLSALTTCATPPTKNNPHSNLPTIIGRGYHQGNLYPNTPPKPLSRQSPQP